MASVPQPRSTLASCSSWLAAWRLGGAVVALPEPSQGALRRMTTAQGSRVLLPFVVSRASPEGTAPAWSPPQCPEGEKAMVSLRGSVGSSPRPLTAI